MLQPILLEDERLFTHRDSLVVLTEVQVSTALKLEIVVRVLATRIERDCTIQNRQCHCSSAIQKQQEVLVAEGAIAKWVDPKCLSIGVQCAPPLPLLQQRFRAHLPDSSLLRCWSAQRTACV